MTLRPMSLTRKFAVLMVLFLTLQGAQLWMGLGGMARLGEEAAFINAAGKQRMRTLLLAIAVVGGSASLGATPLLATAVPAA